MNMNITQIIRKKNYYEVTADGEIFEIDGEFLRQYHIQTGAETAREILEELHAKSRFRRAYRRASHLLDEREYSYCVMYQKLMQTYHDELLCENVMQQLVQCGAINDERYAKKFTEYLVRAKHYGIYRVRQELLKKGIDKRLAETCLAEFSEISNENLSAVLEKKYARVLTDEHDRQTIQKVIAGMTRLGYEYEPIKQAIEEYFRNLN